MNRRMHGSRAGGFTLVAESDVPLARGLGDEATLSELGFVAEERARTVAAGRAAVEREIQREGAGRVSLEDLARSFGCADTDEFFAAVGRETIGTKALQQALRGPASEPAEVGA